MNIEDYKNCIFIVEESTKKSLLNKINDKLINIKIFTLNEIKRKYFFDYTKETLYYIVKKYNVVLDVAKKYIDNLYYIKEDINIENDKVNFLISLKRDLDSKKLLKYNSLFKNYLKNKKVILYNLDNISKMYKNIFDSLDIISINDEKDNDIKKIYKANNSEEEITFVASEICKLIKNGVNINKIKLANVNSNYYFKIYNIFRLFNIPINLESNTSINGTIIVKKFKEYYSSNMEETLNNLKKYIKTIEDQEIYNQIVNLVSEYCFIDDYEDARKLIFDELNNIKKKQNKLKNAVKCINLTEDIIQDDEYVFLINFNEGVIPIDNKDEDYLNDEIKIKLNVDTSNELNYINNLNLKNVIKSTKNLIVSYSKYDMNNEIFISSAYDENIFKEEALIIDYNHSNNYNKIKLLSEKDENNKYGTISDILIKLNNHYKNEKYMMFNNKFKGIDKTKLYSYIDNKLTLSYTSINSYYKCGFRYYIDYILRLNKYEDTFEIVVGNIFHNILSECFIDNYDFDNSWEREIKNSNYDFNSSENYFLTILKDELLLIIETIKNNLKYTQLTKNMYEKEIIVDVNENLHITFKGFIDKIMYNEFDGETIMAIVDYKTGNPNLNINNVVYGIDMQLPIYIYLVKNSNEFKNVKIGGFYLQKILNNSTNYEDKIASLKLQGYSNSDINILEKVDSSYEYSKIIKSLRVSNKGFYSYSKVINDEQIDKISNIVKEKIDLASKDIMEAKFDINPKQIGENLEGCKFCKYKDICYMNNKDIIKLNIPSNILDERGDESA